MTPQTLYGKLRDSHVMHVEDEMIRYLVHDVTRLQGVEGLKPAPVYTGPEHNMPVSDIRVDKVLIGSCTDSRGPVRCTAAIAGHFVDLRQ